MGSPILGKPQQMNGMTSDGDRSIFVAQGTRVTTDQNDVPNFDWVTQAWPTHQNGVLNVFQDLPSVLLALLPLKSEYDSGPYTP